MNKRNSAKVLTVLSVFCQTDARVMNIMPIGDSITWGGVAPQVPEAPGGYRGPLYDALKESGQQVQFVGPLGVADGNPSPTQTKDKQAGHAGYRGFRSDELSTCLDGSLPQYGLAGFWLKDRPGKPALNPDIILLMSGSNDILQGKGVMVASANLENMIIKIRTLRPNASIVLATIPPVFGSLGGQVVQYNQNVKLLAVKYQQQGAHIEVVDQHTPLLPFGKQFGDAVHPDGITYRAMALTWLPKVLIAIYKKTVAEQQAAK